jgi:hypothetical protein
MAVIPIMQPVRKLRPICLAYGDKPAIHKMAPPAAPNKRSKEEDGASPNKAGVTMHRQLITTSD